MDKLKLRFYYDDIEEVVIEDFSEDWTWDSIERALDNWLHKTCDIGYELIEMNGKPYKEE